MNGINIAQCGLSLKKRQVYFDLPLLKWIVRAMIKSATQSFSRTRASIKEIPSPFG
jgi:hypothetical protein